MYYYHCPLQFKRKPYGCGRGPYNATQAHLDMGMFCMCGKELKRYHPTRVPKSTTESTCIVTGVTGKRYCTQPVVAGAYCARHKHMAVTG